MRSTRGRKKQYAVPVGTRKQRTPVKGSVPKKIGRPKGSKNKTNTVKEEPLEFIKVETLAPILAETIAPLLKETLVPVLKTLMKDTLKPLIEKKLKELVEDLVNKYLLSVKDIHKAGILDAWRQRAEYLLANNQVPDAEFFAALFANSMDKLEVTLDELQAEVEKVRDNFPQNTQASQEVPKVEETPKEEIEDALKSAEEINESLDIV